MGLTKEHIERTREWLDSGSTGATATKVLLCTLAVSGAIVAVAMAPAIAQLLKSYSRKGRYSKEKSRNALNYARRSGLVEVIKEKDRKKKIRLTTKGEQRVKEFSLETIEIKKPDQWDGKWRVVVYDIPNRFSRARDALRFKIDDLGFFQIQRSVWVHPYPCKDEILFVAKTFFVERYIEIFEITNLLHEDRLLKRFNLSKQASITC